jgi:hypothetical protein
VGKDINEKTVRDISAEALGHAVNVLTPDQIGLNIPVGSLVFEDIAAPAGLASLAWN